MEVVERAVAWSKIECGGLAKRGLLRAFRLFGEVGLS